jgi:hypothetical protein
LIGEAELRNSISAPAEKALSPEPIIKIPLTALSLLILSKNLKHLKLEGGSESDTRCLAFYLRQVLISFDSSRYALLVLIFLLPNA